jgi:hypothetical protein
LRLAGAKVEILFLTGKKKMKFFLRFLSRLNHSLLSISQGTSRVLRGAKVNNSFISHKLFLIFIFENLFSLISIACQFLKERRRCCGCKSRPFFRLNKAFFKLFLIYFLIIQ